MVTWSLHHSFTLTVTLTVMVTVTVIVSWSLLWSLSYCHSQSHTQSHLCSPIHPFTHSLCVWLCVTVCDCVWLCGWEGKSHVTLVCDVTEWMRGWWVMDDERWWVLCAEKWWEVMRSGGWLMRSDGWVVGEWWKTQKRNSSTRGSQVVTYPSTRLAWGGLTSRSGTRSGANRLVWPELLTYPLNTSYTSRPPPPTHTQQTHHSRPILTPQCTKTPKNTRYSKNTIRISSDLP